MKRDGWSMRHLARRAGVSEDTLKRWLLASGGRGEPPITEAIKLAGAMGLTLDALFRGEDDVDQISEIVRETVARMRRDEQRTARRKPEDRPAPNPAA